MVETGGNPMARDVTVTGFGKLTRGFLSIYLVGILQKILSYNFGLEVD